MLNIYNSYLISYIRNVIKILLNKNKLVQFDGFAPINYHCLEKEICYYQWKGTGYIVLNTDTSEAAYMNSGTLCGGSSVEDIGLFAVTILLTVAAVFTLGVMHILCGADSGQ